MNKKRRKLYPAAFAILSCARKVASAQPPSSRKTRPSPDYKAGRYGVGHSTARILAELGYEIDLSVVPGTDLSPQFGPDFSHCGVQPYWFGEAEALLEIPLSIGYAGLLSHSGGLAYALTMNARLKALHVPGILARLHLIERISLTPEGISFEEQRRLTRALLREGQRIFNFAYHSPSLAPGNTPYVRSNADLRAFLRRIEEYLEFFLGEIGGRPATPFEVKALAERWSPPSQSVSGSERKRGCLPLAK